MKKLLSFILIAIMLVPATAYLAPATPTKTITASLAFQTPAIHTTDGTSTVTIANTNSWLHTPGAPVLPSPTPLLHLPPRHHHQRHHRHQRTHPRTSL